MVDFLKLFLEFFYFVLCGIIFFYIPGTFALSYIKQKLEFPTNVFLATILGIVIFTFVMYLLNAIHLPIVIYPVAGVVIWYSSKKKLLKVPIVPKTQKLPMLLIAALAIVFSLQMIFNGNFGDSIYYFGDDMAHLGYISELRLGTFPYEHPATAGIPLRGYHFFYDFLIAQFSNVTRISHFSLYFHFLPLLISFGWAFGTYSLLYNWTKRVSAGLWGVFFVLFGTSFGYVSSFLGNSHMDFSSSFGINQPITALWNAPYSFSIVILLGITNLMFLYLKKKELATLILLSFLVGLTTVFKVYSGMIALTGLGTLVALELCRKNFQVLIAPIIAFVLTCATYLVFAGKGAALFYLPLWPIERMVDANFPEYDYKEKIRTYSEQSVIRGLASTYAFGFGLFILGNLGSRIIGIFLLPLIYFKNRKLPSEFSIVLLSMTLICVILPMIVAQTIKVFELIQITWYYMLFASLFSAVGLSFFLTLKFSKILKILLSIVIVMMTLPPIYSTFQDRIIPMMQVDRQEFSSDYFQGMQYLKDNGTYNETVLELPLGEEYAHKDRVDTWFNKGASAHIPAFGEKRSYLGNQFIVFPNMPIDDRTAFIADVNRAEFEDNSEKSREAVEEKLKANGIVYIYTTRPITLFDISENVKIVYQNPSTVIYKIEN